MHHTPADTILFPASWTSLADAFSSAVIFTDSNGRLLHGNVRWQAMNRDERDTLYDLVSEWVRQSLAGSQTLSKTFFLSDHRSFRATCEPLKNEDNHFGMVRFQPGKAEKPEDDIVAIGRETAARWALLSARMNSVADVAAGLAHEINNPLGGLLQTVQLLSRNLSVEHERTRAQMQKTGFTEEEIEKFGRYIEERQLLYFLQIIGESGERARNMVAYMVEFSRQRPSEHHEVDLVTLLHRCIELAKLDTDMRKTYQFGRLPVELQANPPYIGGICVEQQAKYILLRALKRHAAGLHAADLQQQDFIPELHIELSYSDASSVVEFIDNGLPPDDEEIRLAADGTLEAVWSTQEKYFDLAVGSFLLYTYNHGRYIIEKNGQGGSTTRLVFPRKNGSSNHVA